MKLVREQIYNKMIKQSWQLVYYRMEDKIEDHINDQIPRKVWNQIRNTIKTRGLEKI